MTVVHINPPYTWREGAADILASLVIGLSLSIVFLAVCVFNLLVGG